MKSIQTKYTTVGIIGSTGFVGKALSSSLQKKGYNVRKINRKSHGDFTTITNWTHLLEGCDFVVHLAGIAHVDLTSLTTEDYRKNNVYLTREIGKACLKIGVKRLIFLSTIKVNGEGLEIPYNEDTPVNPEDIYAKSKFEAELELLRIFSEKKDRLTILRPPLIYGKGVKANMRALLKLASLWLPLPFSNYQSPKSLLFLGNLVSAIEATFSAKSLTRNIYLISDDDDQSLSSIISTTREAIGLPKLLFPLPFNLEIILIKIFPTKKETIQKLSKPLYLSSKKIQEDLNWTPPYTFREGISRTLKSH